jgi:hypothetical protein
MHAQPREHTFWYCALALAAIRGARDRRRHANQVTPATRIRTTAREPKAPASTPAWMPLLPDGGMLVGGGGSWKPELNGCCDGSTSCNVRGCMPVACACACNVPAISDADRSLLQMQSADTLGRGTVSHIMSQMMFAQLGMAHNSSKGTSVTHRAADLQYGEVATLTQILQTPSGEGQAMKSCVNVLQARTAQTMQAVPAALG